MLGEFEYLLITASASLGDEAYGAAIREEIQKNTGRRCSIGALYTTIDRLEQKGLLKTWMGAATPQRGGRSKRMVRVTSQGVVAAKDFYEAVTRISQGASWATRRAGEIS
jgi:PadR family transcriptional regulator, regulatory protein PadR